MRLVAICLHSICNISFVTLLCGFHHGLELIDGLAGSSGVMKMSGGYGLRPMRVRLSIWLDAIGWLKRQSILPLPCFQRILGREERPHLIQIRSKLRFDILWLDGCYFIDNGFGPGIIANLQVSIFKKVERMKSMVHHVLKGGRVLACCLNGREIGLNVILPQTEPGKNVRRHVQRMCRRWRYARIKTSGRQPFVRELRFIASMNKIVRYPGMVRFYFEQIVQNGNGLTRILNLITISRRQ